MGTVASLDSRLRKLEQAVILPEAPVQREGESEIAFMLRLGTYYEGPKYLLNAVIKAQEG